MREGFRDFLGRSSKDLLGNRPLINVHGIEETRAAPPRQSVNLTNVTLEQNQKKTKKKEWKNLQMKSIVSNVDRLKC